jgi:quinol monooxygenase YgiN
VSRRSDLREEAAAVSIFQTAHYQVEPDAVDDVKAAIVQLVAHVSDHEPGTVMYRAWQSPDDPSKFVHLFEFTDDEAHQRHGGSNAVRTFESVYQPRLVGGTVVFTDYIEVARNRP